MLHEVGAPAAMCWTTESLPNPVEPIEMFKVGLVWSSGEAEGVKISWPEVFVLYAADGRTVPFTVMLVMLNCQIGVAANVLVNGWSTVALGSAVMLGPGLLPLAPMERPVRTLLSR